MLCVLDGCYEARLLGLVDRGWVLARQRTVRMMRQATMLTYTSPVTCARSVAGLTCDAVTSACAYLAQLVRASVSYAECH